MRCSAWNRSMRLSVALPCTWKRQKARLMDTLRARGLSYNCGGIVAAAQRALHDDHDCGGRRNDASATRGHMVSVCLMPEPGRAAWVAATYSAVLDEQ